MLLLQRPSLWFLLFLSSLCWLQGEPTPRPLTWDDVDAWRSIETPILSRNGEWLAYSYMPAQGNGDVIARHLPDGREIRLPVGATPPPPFPRPTHPDEKAPPVPKIGLLFTHDSRFLLTTTFSTAEALAAARISGAHTPESKQRGLVIVDLTTGKSETIKGVKSVQVSVHGNWVAYQMEPEIDPIRRAHPNTKHGTRLVLRDLAAGKERTFDSVTEYSLTRDGRTLVYAVAGPSERRNGLYAYTPGSWSSPEALLRGRGRYLKLNWDLAQTQLAFLSDRSAGKTGKPPLKVYLWTRGSGAAPSAVVTADTAGVFAGMVPSEQTAPAFSRDGRKLFVGVALPPATPTKPQPDPEDRVVADIWSWHDGLIQSRQSVLADTERKRTFTGVFDLATKHYTQVATPTLAEVTLSDDGAFAIGLDETPYLRERDYDGTYADIYVINTATGERRLAVKKLRGKSGDEGRPGVSFSPDGRWATYYANGAWYAIEIATAQSHALTTGLPVSFAQELHDDPEPAPSYGWAGWTRDSQSVMIYDRYDIWQMWPDGRAARNLTQGYGRAEKIILRAQDIAAHEEGEAWRGIDPARPLYLRGEDETTRASGFYRYAFESTGKPERLLWGDKQFRYIGRAQDAGVLLLTASRFDEFPDVWRTDETFSAPQRITDGAAQLAPFAWGSAELVGYTNTAGEPLQGLLYKPANFDPQQKYPLIVYTYERLSHIVHNFFPPVYSSNINFPFYTSNGYLVLLCDIAYDVGHPGQSALECVNAAVDAVIARGGVDEDRLGIQGSSWGGYQSAYIITQTNRFRAAEAGAVVGNMTSAYGGIRLTSGQPRLFQYEQTQSRIGQPLTDAPELYLENSPVFHVKQVQTPLLIQHNDLDGAVPWEQAVELFLALRRHNKPVWLINYAREGHGLSRYANKRDFSLRLWQFFEHYLHDQPAPDWLTKGVPYLDREAEKLRFNKP
jgi:dipeptidyl aminopeptidase/acylaminoacyl peptidase